MEKHAVQVYAPEFALPEYKPGKIGPWELGSTRDLEWPGNPVPEQYVYATGYSTGEGFEPHCHFLWRKDEATGQNVPWMNTGRLEQESHKVHVRASSGVVVIVGGGMGMALKAISDKPDVTKVVLIERDPQIIDLIQHHTDFESWPGRAKISFVTANALAPALDDHVARIAGVRPGETDFLYVDIWEKLGDERDMDDTRAIQAQLRAKRVGFWGQELAYVAWCSENGVDRDELLDLSTWDRFQLAMGMALPHRSHEYLFFCVRAAIQQSQRRVRMAGSVQHVSRGHDEG